MIEQLPPGMEEAISDGDRLSCIACKSELIIRVELLDLQRSPTLRAPDQTEQGGDEWWDCDCGIANFPEWEYCQFCKYPRPNRSVGG